MIARITYKSGGKPAVATLGDDGRWTAPDPLQAAMLNLFYQGADRSPARGNWQQFHARKMAGMLGGTVEFEAKESMPPGTIY